jgi:hypothetical protein
MDERICAGKIGNGGFYRINRPGKAINPAETRIYARTRQSQDNVIGLSAGRVRRSAASEGVPAALRLSKSAQSADKVHFSDSTRLRRARNPVPVTTVSGHKRSFLSLIDQIEAFLITKHDFQGDKSYFLPLGGRSGKVQP